MSASSPQHQISLTPPTSPPPRKSNPKLRAPCTSSTQAILPHGSLSIYSFRFPIAAILSAPHLRFSILLLSRAVISPAQPESATPSPSSRQFLIPFSTSASTVSQCRSHLFLAIRASARPVRPFPPGPKRQGRARTTRSLQPRAEPSELHRVAVSSSSGCVRVLPINSGRPCPFRGRITSRV